MHKHIFKKNNQLKRILAACIVVILLCGLAAPTFASDGSEIAKEKNVMSDEATEKIQEEDIVNSRKIQKEFDEQMTALMSLEDVGEIDVQDANSNFIKLYPQYANYDGEMEGVSVEKTWIGDAEYNRPESVTFELYLEGTDTVIDSLTLTAADDWKGSFSNHYPAYQLNEKGEYAKDENGEKIPLKYTVKERSVTNYKAAYSIQAHQTTVDSSSVHLFVPATELKAGEKYIAVSSNQAGQQKIFRAEAYQTDKMLTSQINISDTDIKDKDGNHYNNYILMNDGDGSYEGLLWNAYGAGNNKFYMFSNVYEIWGECHGLIEMSMTQNKMKCPHVGNLGAGTDISTQGFYHVDGEKVGNTYKTASSSENLYFYKEVTLPEGAFNNWQTEAYVSNRYEPPITVDPGEGTESSRTEMVISKKWVNDSEDDRPDSVTVHLYKNGELTDQTVTLNKENKWTDSFKDLDMYDKEGKKISYSVSEDVPEGYSASYTYENMDSTNSSDTKTDDQTKGYWVRTDKLVDGETYLIVTSPNAGNVVGMEITESGKNFNWTAGNAGTINVSGSITLNGTTYATHITQEEAAKHTRMQWTAKYAKEGTYPQAGYHKYFLLNSVSNPGCYPKFNGKGDISDGSAEESLLYYGLQYTTGDKGQNGYVALDENGKTQITPTVENYPNDFNYVFGNCKHYFLLTEQQTGDANAVTAQTFYLYKFVPVSGPSVTITNTKSEKTSLTVYKNWNDKGHENVRPTIVQVVLLENGKETNKKVKLSKDNNWTYIFEDLPKLDKNGKEITYSVKEVSIDEHYSSSVTIGTSGGSKDEVTYSYAWVPVTKMEAGKEYIITKGKSGSVQTIGIKAEKENETDKNKKVKVTMSGTNVTILSDKTLTSENDNKYTSYITDEEALGATKWTAHASGSGEYVTLEYSESYVSKFSGDLETDNKKAAQIQYDDQKHALTKVGNNKNDKNIYLKQDGNFGEEKQKAEVYIYECVKIKETITVDTTQNVATITNTYKEEPKVDFILQKLNGNSGEKLSGNYTFTLKNSAGEVAGNRENVKVDENGQIRFKDLPYGEYTLEETQTENAYGKLPAIMKLTVSETGITLNNAEELRLWVDVTKANDGINMINVKNYKLLNLPESGSNNGIKVIFLGFALVITGVLINKKTKDYY